MDSSCINEHFKQKPNTLFYLCLILHAIRSSQFISFAIFDMFKINEQRVCIKFCFNLNKYRLTNCQDLKNRFLDDNFIK